MPRTLGDGTVQFEAKLPSAEEETKVYRAFGIALEHLQNRTSELNRLLEAQGEGNAPSCSFEDIGRLYSFIENVKLDRWALDQEVANLESHLHEIYILKDDAGN